MTTGSFNLDYYVAAFEKLRRDPSQSWPAAALGKAPYKPLLLLSVIDLFAEGSVSEIGIRLDPALFDLFNSYWELVMSGGGLAISPCPFTIFRVRAFGT